MEVSRFSTRIRIIPTRPGIYIMKASDEQVLYVGKASNLRTRLRSYFGSLKGHNPKIQHMLSLVRDFDFIITDTSAEALILENTLIKKYRPQFNARLKDDKTYPYIKIDQNEDFPQVYITRRVEDDGASYFGPFASARSIRRSLELLKKLFPYRSCTKVITGNDARPCLEYHINRCTGPCIGAISGEGYHKVIDQVILFLQGKTKPVLHNLQNIMWEASGNLEFEKAAVLRDQITAIQTVTDEQRIKTGSTNNYDLDAIGVAAKNDYACVEVFFVRQGNLVGRDNFVMYGTQHDPLAKILSVFVKQFYQSSPLIPPRILLDHLIEGKSEIQALLRNKHQTALAITIPQKGPNRELVKMATQNAHAHLSQLQAKWWNNNSNIQSSMIELQEELNLPTLPHRIECYDISNTQGSNPVGSMVVFEGGVSKSSDYRRFKIRESNGIDDYTMTQEVLRRRFRRLSIGNRRDGSTARSADQNPTTKEDTWRTIPNLVLIDGGKGHLSSALEVFLEMGIDFVPLASIAKENEYIYVPQVQEPIILPRASQSLRLLQRIRDEAHRFAITYHRNLRSKSSVISVMDMVKGIGPKRKKMLIQQFGSIKGIRDASVDEIAVVRGITQPLAIRLKQILSTDFKTSMRQS